MLDKAADKNSVKPAEKKEPVVVKKYANRRLYNTETSTYVTLDDLAAMVKAERDFVVYDAKSGDDLTHSVLTQIIVEQEGRMATGQTMLPIPFLRQLIRFYGDSIGKMVPSYLQVSLDTLTREQSRVREQFTSAFSPQSALEAYHEQARKNLAMFEQAMTMFSPFGPGQGPGNAQKIAGGDAGETEASGTQAAKTPATVPASTSNVKGLEAKSDSEPVPKLRDDSQLSEMRAQLSAMQMMIDKLAKDRE